MAAIAVNLPWQSLEGVGFGAIATGYCGYAAWLVKRGRIGLRADIAGPLYLAAIVFTGLWGALSWFDLGSTKIWTWHGAEQLDQIRYLIWCLFLLALAGPAAARPDRSRLTVPAALAVSGITVNLIAGFSDSADMARWFAALHLAWPILTITLIEQIYRNQSDQHRWAAKPLCLGIGGWCVFDILLYSEAMLFGLADGDVLAARGMVHAVMLALLVFASGRQTGWLGKIHISNVTVFYSASLLLIGLYLVGVSAIGYYVRYFGGTWGGVAQVVVAFGSVVALLLVVLSGSARAKLRVFIGKNILRYHYDYRREWLRFTTMLSSEGSPQSVGILVTRGLADMVESPGGGLWFKALGDDEFVQTARWNIPEISQHEAPESDFCVFLREHEWIVDMRAPTKAQLNRLAAPATPSWLAQIENIWLVIPLLAANSLLGFVVLVKPRTPIELNWEIRDLLKTAARQAAGFLAQMHATEALLEARKFDAFNRMSAFVVHDLKNIITQLSLLLKNAERHRDNPEFQRDMLMTIETSLEKMRQMMLQLREGTKPVGASSGVELRPLLQRIVNLAMQHERVVILEIVDRLATRGHDGRLERVIGHIVQNALDATPPDGKVWIRLQQSAGRAELTVGDTGRGMTQEFIRTRLFRPFSSTKASGMGIGTYESWQYIRELGGNIEVNSQANVGTVITIHLPLFDVRTETDLRVMEPT